MILFDKNKKKDNISLINGAKRVNDFSRKSNYGKRMILLIRANVTH